MKRRSDPYHNHFPRLFVSQGQFRHSWARNVYGLPDDETMRMEDSGGKARPEDLLSRNKTQVLGKLEHEGKQVPPGGAMAHGHGWDPPGHVGAGNLHPSTPVEHHMC